MTREKNIYIIIIVLLISLVNGCAVFSSKIDKPEKKEVKLYWPGPPLEPRIEFLRTVVGEASVSKVVERTFLIKVFEFITGAIFGRSNVEAMIVRPYGIAEFDDIIFVADEKLSVVHLLDFKGNVYHQVGMTRKGSLVTPIGVVVDNEGNFYVSDTFHKKIFVYNKDRINISEIGGNDTFARPTGLAINKDEKLLYVVDTVLNKIQVFDLQGNYKFEFGKRGKDKGDELNFPTNIFIDKEGTVFLCDSMNFKVKLFDKDGNFLSMFGKIGDKLGYFARPKGIAVDSDGHIYVVEALFDRVQIFDKKGQFLLTFGTTGNQPGAFWLPSGLFIDSKDRIYVSDSYNNRIQVFKYLKPGSSPVKVTSVKNE